MSPAIKKLYLYIVILSFISEQLYNDCKSKTLYTYVLSILHHFSSMFLYLGPFLFNYHRFHLTIMILTLIGWMSNSNKCLLSLEYNKKCGINKDVNFKDLTYRFYEIFKINRLHWKMSFMLIIYDIYMIMK